MKIQAGWAEEYDSKGVPQVGTFSSVEEASMHFPEVYGDGEKDLAEAIRIMDYVNSEGNFHEFVFRVVEV